MGLLTAKPGGTFIGNLLRGVGINKSPVPGFAPAIQTGQNSQPLFNTTANVTPINPGSGLGATNTTAQAGAAVTGKDFYILGAVILLFVLFKKRLGL